MHRRAPGSGAAEADATPRRRRPARRVNLTAATFVRALAAIAVVWLWLRLWRWLLVFLVGVFLAIALDPVVQWLDKRGVRRAYAAPLVMLVLVAVLAGFFVAAGASLAQEAQLVGQRLREFHESVLRRIPQEFQEAGSSLAQAGQSGTSAGRAIIDGTLSAGVAFIVAVYLLLDGRRTYEWLLAFVPLRARSKMHETARGAHAAIFAYVRGNLITSALAALFTWIVLAALHVPAALLLALLAGVLDLVPVIGFVLSAAPAVLLGFIVSPGVGVAVAVFYVAYNLVENYFIQPKVYGRELRLSDLAVIAAFIVGAELGGVLGAIVALPLAAIYPTIERVWLRAPQGTQLREEHERIESEPEH